MSEYNYETLHRHLLKDKEMIRCDCDQSERVHAEHYSHLLVNTEFVFLFVFIIFIIIIIFNVEIETRLYSLAYIYSA